MKYIRRISLAALLVCLFCAMDLGFNFLYNLMPEVLDGYTSHSLLQSAFEVFGDRNWTRERFFHAFETSAWVTFALLIENVVLHFAAHRNRK